MANPGTGYYSSSKYFEGLMEALDKELRPLNISVIYSQVHLELICPADQ